MSNRVELEAVLTTAPIFDGPLKSRVILITGSTHGLGRAAAERFATRDARLAITGRDRVAGEAVAAAIRETGAQAQYFWADVTDDESVEQMIDEVVKTFGGIDVLVNNAAGVDRLRNGQDGAVHLMDLGLFDELMRVNLRGVFVVLRYVLPHLIASDYGGVIVNVSSISALVGHRGFDAYTAAKGALLSLTRSLAAEYAECNVRANCVVVGFVPHEDERPTHQARSGLDRNLMIRSQLIKRLGRPDDVARAIVFLSSNEQSGFITGQTLVVDGGVVAGSPVLAL